MILYTSRTMSALEVKAEITSCRLPGKTFEYHVMLHGNNHFLTYEQQLKNMLEACKVLLHDEPEKNLTPVFARCFLSDAANQAPLLEESLQAFPPLVASIVQQPPLNGTKIAMWLYLTGRATGTFVSGNLLAVTRNTYTHYWIGNKKVAGGNSETQTGQLLQSYENDLKELDCSISANCIRTWFFVQNVDVNYAGVVKARRENFMLNGLTEDTHYITSTGIEGRDADPTVHVLLDAYAIKGLRPEQISYLYAYSHLSPTRIYGVTFERGVAVTYGDRKHLYISGTASIDNKGKVMHAGDIRRQTARMWENVEQLLEEGGATSGDIAQMIVYLRDTGDYTLVKELFDERFGNTPKQILLAPVCRPSWLIEMECIAIVPTDKNGLPDF